MNSESSLLTGDPARVANGLYPPSPDNVPPEITRLDNAYRGRVLAMIAGLFAFLLLYLLFIAAAGLLAWALLTMPIPNIRGRGILIILIFKFGGAFAAALLWLFLLKGLFKSRRVDRSGYVALREADHPELFAFIRQVYQDVGAPRPRTIFASPDVNAALIYNTSVINLVLPPKKDLLIGLGLVNVLTLAEFKAVMAHEFGHFAQRSVGLGSYLYVANRIMSDVIYSRDGLDRFVDTWSQQDVRVSFPAWGLKGVLWVVRKMLSGTFQGLNLLRLSLSRQLEFNADNVAVRLTGSDALIHGLSRAEFANESLADASRSLNAAADHALFTDDLFYHQTQSAARLRKLRKDERAGLPPDLPPDSTRQVQVFSPVDDGVPERYRSHPTDHSREKNAKRIYIRSPRDDRSPWLLFGDVVGLKREVTAQFYRHALGRSEEYAPQPAATVQQFIDAEHAETSHDPKYHGLYDDRFLTPGDLAIPREPWPQQAAAAWLANWPPADLQQRIETFQRRRSEYHLLNGLKNGELSLKGKTFQFREQECTKTDVERLFTQVDGELDSDIAALAGLDRDAFLGHCSLARHLDQGVPPGPRETELLERYRFQITVQGLMQKMMSEQAQLQSLIGYLSGNTQLAEEDFRFVTGKLREMRDTLGEILEQAKSCRTPALTNVPAGSSLHDLILDRSSEYLPELRGESISGEWIGKLGARLDGVLSRIRRVHFKSLGSLLAYQEKLAAEWRFFQTGDGEPVTTTVDSIPRAEIAS